MLDWREMVQAFNGGWVVGENKRGQFSSHQMASASGYGVGCIQEVMAVVA